MPVESAKNGGDGKVKENLNQSMFYAVGVLDTSMDKGNGCKNMSRGISCIHAAGHGGALAVDIWKYYTLSMF